MQILFKKKTDKFNEYNKTILLKKSNVNSRLIGFKIGD